LRFEENSVVLEGNVEPKELKHPKIAKRVRDVLYARNDEEKYLSKEFLEFWLRHKMSQFVIPISWS